MPNADVRSVAQSFVDLQEERHAADYDHQDTFDAKRLRVAIATSNKAVTALEALRNDPAMCAFISLLALGVLCVLEKVWIPKRQMAAP